MDGMLGMVVEDQKGRKREERWMQVAERSGRASRPIADDNIPLVAQDLVADSEDCRRGKK